jgi:hypothetical protein
MKRMKDKKGKWEESILFVLHLLHPLHVFLLES